MILSFVLAAGILCPPALPRCPMLDGGVVFCCGKAYPCLDIEEVRIQYEGMAKSGDPAYAYALSIYYRVDCQDKESAIDWLEMPAKVDFFTARFDLADLKMELAIRDDNEAQYPLLMRELSNLAEGNPILEARLGALLVKSKKMELRGLEWLEKATRNGSLLALGLLVEVLERAGDRVSLELWCEVMFAMEELDIGHASEICVHAVDSEQAGKQLEVSELARSIMEKAAELDRQLTACQGQQGDRGFSSDFQRLD